MATMVLITGNTYPVKEQLRDLGGQWDKDAKGWQVPADKADEARKLVDSAGSGNAESGGKKPYSGPKRCRICGVVQTFNARGYPNVRIYRSGECQDCFEERKGGY